MQQIISPFQLFVDPSGQPIENGSVYIGPINVNPAISQIAVYWDEAGTTPAAQPLKVSGGLFVRNGTPTRVYFGADDYSISLYDKKGALVYYLPSATSQATLRTDLAASTGAWLLGWIQLGIGAIFRWVGDKLREWVSPQDFGAVGDGVTNDSAAFNLAIASCLATGRGLRVPGKTYLLTSGAVNFAGQGLVVVGEGTPVLKYTGSGRAFELNGGTNGSGVGEMRVENFLVIGNPLTTDGFYKSGVWRSFFKNIEVRECAGTAFNILHGVSSTYQNLKYSINAAAQTTKPTKGVVLNNTGVGYYTADCTFINCVAEGFAGLGIDIIDGTGNVFVGGTFEAVTKGITIEAGCDRNHFINVWCEGNTVSDLEVYGRANSFDECFFVSAGSGNNVELITAQGTNFRGGFVRVANMQSTSRDTSFFGVGLSDNASLNFKGVGSYTRVGCTGVNINGAVSSTYSDITRNQWITFPAVQVPSNDVNTLDDYEEGTWTPALVPESGSITANAGLTGGRYTKVGNVVTINGSFYTSSVSSPSGFLKMTGIPFVTGVATFDYTAATVTANNLQATATTQVTGQLEQGQGYITLRKFSAGVLSDLGGDVKAATDFKISATYQVYQP